MLLVYMIHVFVENDCIYPPSQKGFTKEELQCHDTVCTLETSSILTFMFVQPFKVWKLQTEILSTWYIAYSI